MERKVSVASILGTVILILLSLEKVTTVGLYEGKCTIYQTISISEKTFDLALNGVKMNNTPFVILFFIGIALLFVPGFVLFNQSKCRSIIIIVFDVIGTILVFILFNSCQYMYMMILISLLIASNIFIRVIENYNNWFEWLMSVITALICFFNVYYSILHLHMWQSWDNGISNGNLDNVLDEMINISKINVACLAVWIIPCVVIFCKEFLFKKKS